MPRIAFLTHGNMLEVNGHPAVQGFWDRTDGVFSILEQIPGFIQTVDGQYGRNPPHSYFFDPSRHKEYAVTLSLWTSLEPVYAHAYYGRHGEVFRLRKAWVQKPDFPNYVAWWVADDHTPTWEEGYENQRLLHELGSTPCAFSFKKAFDAQGNPYTLDKNLITKIIQETPVLAPFRFVKEAPENMG